jgi:hypothetical protein
MVVATNPYDPPQADTTVQQPSGRRGWRIYAYSIGLLFLATFGFQVSKSDAIGLSDCIDALLGLLCLVGLLGYAYRRPLFGRRFWMAASVLLPLWAIATEIWEYPWVEHRTSSNSTFDYMGMSALFFPLFLALVLYGYRSKEIWAKTGGAG